MRGRAFIDRLRDPVKYINPEHDEMRLLADAVEMADGVAKAAFEYEPDAGDGWIDAAQGYLRPALSYLSRRGFIERHPTMPTLIRIVEAA